MRYRFFLFFFLLGAVFFLTSGIAKAESQNAGFVPANIWYSKDPFSEGDKIKIFTLVFNPDVRRFTGTVAFFDDTTLIGKKDFSLASTTAEAIAVEWVATVGQHKIFAKITNPKFEISPNKFEDIYLAKDETDKSVRTVNKKIPQISEVKDKINETLNSSALPVKTLSEKITEKTPSFISKPISILVDTTEIIRNAGMQDATSKRDEAKLKIEIIKSSNAGVKLDPNQSINDDIKNVEERQKNKSKQTADLFDAPFAYAKMFIFTVYSVIFSYPVLFYGLIFVLLLLLARTILRIIF